MSQNATLISKCWRIMIGFLFMSGLQLHAQPPEKSSETSPKATTTTKHPLQKLRLYVPYHRGLHHADPESENNDYKTIRRGLDHIEGGLMRLVLLRFEPVEEAIRKETIHQNAYKSLLFDMKARYYKAISRRAQHNLHMHQTLLMLEAAHERFLEIEGSLPFFGHNPSDLKNTLYRIKRLRGVLGFFRGTPNDLRQAIEDFEYIIGHNPENVSYAQNEDETRDIYHYLVNAYRLRYDQNRDNAFLSVYLLQRELFYLYQLTVLNTPDNEPLRDYKLRQLLNRYKSVVNYKGTAYNTLYKLYLPFDDAEEGSRAPATPKQQKEISEPVQPTPKPEDDKPMENSNNSEPKSTE